MVKPQHTAIAVLSAALLLVALSAWWAFARWQTGGEPATVPIARQAPQQPQPPKMAPDFQFTDLHGHRHRLSDWTGRGDYVLINFWATWCAPCRKELPLLLTLQKRYHGRTLQIIGPAIDKPAAVARYVKKAGIKYPVFAARDRAAQLSTRLGDTLNALPYSVLVAPNGRILEAQAGRLHKPQVDAWLKHLTQG